MKLKHCNKYNPHNFFFFRFKQNNSLHMFDIFSVTDLQHIKDNPDNNTHRPHTHKLFNLLYPQNPS